MNPTFMTLLGQMITFAILIWFTVKFIWPPLMSAIEERQQKIAEGLAAADNAQKNLAQAQDKVNEELKAARSKANEIIDQAHQRANQLIDAAKADAIAEGRRLKALAEGGMHQHQRHGEGQGVDRRRQGRRDCRRQPPESIGRG